MNNLMSRHIVEKTLTVTSHIKRRKLPRFVMTFLSPEEQLRWFRVFDEVVLGFFYANKWMNGIDIDFLVIDLWRKHFPERGVDATSQPPLNQIRAVNHCSFKAHSR